MAKINYWVLSKKEGQPATVYIRLSGADGLDVWSTTPIKVYPEYWSNKTQSFKQRILFSKQFTEDDKVELEGRLGRLKEYVLKAQLDNNGERATKGWLKDTIDAFHKIKKVQPETLNQYISRFVKEATLGQRLCFSGKTKKQYASGSLRNLRDFQHSFNLYQGIYTEPKTKRKRNDDSLRRKLKPLDFKDITIDFYNEFIQYFYDKDCSGNYIGKHIKTLKTILRQAREEGFPVNDDIEKKAFRTISEESDSIYLTEEEVKRLYLLDLSDNKVLQIARDVFLCGVYTAQRYSDYSRIKKENIKEIDGGQYVEFRQQKTGEVCIVPIKPELEAILSRYDYTLPKTWEQKINENIKKVAAQAEITERISIEKHKGGLKVKATLMKCDLIKTHTARRTGCTLMYLAKDANGNRIPTIDIMKISGHRTEREFLKYIRVGKRETAINLSSHPYFSGKNLRAV